jgi:hypothetical protein
MLSFHCLGGGPDLTSSNERRRLLIEFGIGEGDSEKPDGCEDLNIAPPEPDSLLGPEWQAAVDGLLFGSVEPLLNALASAELIPPECETFLALAFRGDPRLSVRLVVQGTPLAGQKRAGRPRQNSRPTGAELADYIEQHALHSKWRRNSWPRPCEAIGAWLFG